jgi:hypothetical protein
VLLKYLGDQLMLKEKGSAAVPVIIAEVGDNSNIDKMLAGVSLGNASIPAVVAIWLWTLALQVEEFLKCIPSPSCNFKHGRIRVAFRNISKVRHTHN